MKLLQQTYRAGKIPAWAGLAGVLAALFPGLAAAQVPPADPPVIQPLPPAPPPSAAPPPPALPPRAAPPPSLPPPVQPPPVASPPPLASGEYPAPPPVVSVTTTEEPSSSGLHLSAFADAHYGFQTAARGTPVPIHRAYEFNNYDTATHTGSAQNGFELAFAGLDATYDAGQLGATISLRAGPGVPIFFAGDNGPLGIDNLTQAYATWTPTSQLSIDFGQFSTIFGAEVAESWRNLNYTRGALYYAMQPFWHTGVRATVTPNDQVSLTGMVVNGVNSARDDNDVPSLALQLGVNPNDMASFAAGWYATLRPSSDGNDLFDNFFDLVAALTVNRFSLVFNADLSVNADRTVVGEGYVQTLQDPLFWGLSLALGYQATDLFGVALRGEFLSDSDNQLYQVQRTEFGVTFPTTENTNLGTVTATLDFKPVRGSNNLVIRWDNRIEASNADIFFNHSESPSKVWFGSVLGVVVTTDD